MIERTRMDACPSDLTLDAWQSGELETQAAEQVELHVAKCASCQARRTEHERVHAEFLEAAPTLSALRARVEASKTLPLGDNIAILRKVWATRAIGTFAMCAVVLLAFRPWEQLPAPSTRSKGAPHLGLFIKRAEQVTRAESGASVQADDLLRFTYSSSRDVYLALLNVDAQDTTVYFPTAGTAAPKVRAGSNIALDFSVELDDRPGVERVLGVFCPAAFDTQPLLAALKRSGKLPEAMGCHVDELQLRKQPAH